MLKRLRRMTTPTRATDSRRHPVFTAPQKYDAHGVGEAQCSRVLRTDCPSWAEHTHRVEYVPSPRYEG